MNQHNTSEGLAEPTASEWRLSELRAFAMRDPNNGCRYHNAPVERVIEIIDSFTTQEWGAFARALRELSERAEA